MKIKQAFPLFGYLDALWLDSESPASKKQFSFNPKLRV